MTKEHTTDIAVVGAGVFGAWTAYQLRRSGAEVLLVDAYGPANSRASSGGESRILRLGYGPDEIYTRMAQRSFQLWQQLFEDVERPQLFQPTGVLWLAREHDPYCEATLKTLQQSKVKFARLERADLCQRYPQLEFGPVAWGMLESESGVLLARQAVQALVAEAQSLGVTYVQAAIRPPETAMARLEFVETTAGARIVADKFIFACGPWLPKLFPDLLNELIHVTRQEVFFLGVPAGDERFLPGRIPAWIDFNDLVYGIPNLESRGVKIAIDEHGPPFDPDTGERIVSPESVSRLRAYLARRVPALADAPVIESRVCQYENTSNGDFLIDRHPSVENAWLVGGGSGHGFKHGPAVGELVASLVSNNEQVQRRFGLETKQKLQQRQVY
ncbi:MAG TPA: FAD-dependent oxidoreductase [Pyrinomonadaceae bacterium]|nr:FAD-dependent oxidoreductase [Pyrinomonadaceae bacterium]